MHPAQALPSRQLHVTLICLSQQQLRLHHRNDGVNLRIEPINVQEIGLHHFTTRPVPGLNTPSEFDRVGLNNF